jgi:chromosome segregation ATPase
MLGFAAAGASALVVVAAVGVAIYAWKLAAERDRLEEQLTRPRAEDPALQAARDELHGKQRELELARKRIDELLAGARSDAELQSCRDTLAEARTKLGVAENRASDLSSSVVNYQNQLSTATRFKVDVEARYTSELQIRRSVETERDDLRRTNTKLGDEISRREKHQKLLCDELRSNRVKLPAICKGMP